MAINWDLYNARLNVNGSSDRDRKINSLQSTINQHAQSSPSCKDVTINGVNRKIIVTNTSTGYKKEIHALPNESFDCGDYVVYDGKTYLINEINNNEDVYVSGKMQECNYAIKFQSPDGTILSYPCITSTKSFNQDETKMITLPSNQKSILCAKDSNTLLLKAGRRFYVDTRNESTYKIIGDVDTTTYNYGSKGLLYFVVEQDLEQNNTNNPDRPDLGICNYFEPTITPTPVEGETSATIQRSGELIIGNSNYITLTPKFYNADGSINTSIVANWTYVYPSGYQSKFTIIPDGNNLLIKVAEVYELLGEKLVCSVSDGLGGYVGVVELIIGSGWEEAV